MDKLKGGAGVPLPVVVLVLSNLILVYHNLVQGSNLDQYGHIHFEYNPQIHHI
jgi:hypothetical protein